MAIGGDEVSMGRTKVLVLRSHRARESSRRTIRDTVTIGSDSSSRSHDSSCSKDTATVSESDQRVPSQASDGKKTWRELQVLLNP